MPTRVLLTTLFAGSVLFIGEPNRIAWGKPPQELACLSERPSVGRLVSEINCNDAGPGLYSAASTGAPPQITQNDRARTLYDKGAESMKAKNYADAIKAFSAATEADPRFADAFSLLGQCYYQIGDDLRAISAFKRYLELKPDSPGPLNWLGTAQVKADQAENALKTFQRVLELKPGKDSVRYAYWGVSNALNRLGKFPEALAAANEALKLAPDNPDSLFQLGKAQLGLEHFEEGKAAFEKSLENRPDWTLALEWLAIAFENLDDVDSEIETLRKLLEVDPKYPNASLALGKALLVDFETEEALVAFKDAARLDPKDPEVFFELGYAYQQGAPGTEDFPQAVAALKEAIRLKPDFGEAMLWLGKAYVRMKKKPEAMQVYERLRRIDPRSAVELFADIAQIK